MINLIELQNKIHAQNVQMGWWDDVRPFSTFVCLFHSELSEAMEGDRKGLMDDHLTQYPMAAVELADFIIRCLDWLGSQGNDLTITMPYVTPVGDFCLSLASIHEEVSQAYYSWKQTGVHTRGSSLHICEAVAISIQLAKEMDWPMNQIILEKVEYNKHREDHKREHRAAEGGKKY